MRILSHPGWSNVDLQGEESGVVKDKVDEDHAGDQVDEDGDERPIVLSVSSADFTFQHRVGVVKSDKQREKHKYA